MIPVPARTPSHGASLPRRLWTPVDAASVAVVRWVFGVMVAWDAARHLAYGWVDEYYVLPSIHFTYLFFPFVTPWPDGWMHVHFYALIAAALLVAVGCFYRVAIVALFLLYAYVFLLEESVYMNHYYLIVLLSLLLACMPAERAFSLDRLRRGGPTTVPLWAIWLLRFQLCVVYAYGAVAKLNGDWLRGEPMYSAIVQHAPEVPAIASHFPPALLAYAIAYGGIVVDLAVPLLLLFRRTFFYGFALAVAFHALNEAFLRIGIFSFLMTGAITIFLPPGWPRRLWRRQSVWADPDDGVAIPTALTTVQRTWLATLAVYVVLQLLVPLRHFLYPGEVSWTEEGHRFAWHMKLRKKHSVLTIIATDPRTGASWVIDPGQDLRARQRRKLETFPDILLQYVHHHRDRLRAAGVPDPIITVDWWCSLNGGPWQRLVDPTVNLAGVERTWRPATWLLPRRRGT